MSSAAGCGEERGEGGVWEGEERGRCVRRGGEREVCGEGRREGGVCGEGRGEGGVWNRTIEDLWYTH